MKWLFFIAVLFGTTGLAGAANALDCSKDAVGRDYRIAAICKSPKLLQADHDLNDAYQKLYSGRPKEEQIVLVHMQRDWLGAGRDGGCPATREHPVDEECMYKNMQRRIDFFHSADGTGPSTQGRLTFKGYYLPKKKDTDISIEVSVFEFADPDSAGKKAFNRHAEELLADGKGRGIEDNQSGGDCGSCEEATAMSQPFQSGNFISVPIGEWQATGGAHGTGGTSYENRFLDKDDPITYREIFPEFNAAVIAKQCWDQVIADGDGPSRATDGNYTSDGKEYPAIPSDEFMDAFKQPTNWSFDGKSISVYFGEYVLGTYSEGVQSCVLPYDAISQYSRLDTMPGSPDDIALQARMRPRKAQTAAPAAN